MKELARFKDREIDLIMNSKHPLLLANLMQQAVISELNFDFFNKLNKFLNKYDVIESKNQNYIDVVINCKKLHEEKIIWEMLEIIITSDKVRVLVALLENEDNFILESGLIIDFAKCFSKMYDYEILCDANKILKLEDIRKKGPEYLLEIIKRFSEVKDIVISGYIMTILFGDKYEGYKVNDELKLPIIRSITNSKSSSHAGLIMKLIPNYWLKKSNYVLEVIEFFSKGYFLIDDYNVDNTIEFDMATLRELNNKFGAVRDEKSILDLIIEIKKEQGLLNEQKYYFWEKFMENPEEAIELLKITEFNQNEEMDKLIKIRRKNNNQI